MQLSAADAAGLKDSREMRAEAENSINMVDGRRLRLSSRAGASDIYRQDGHYTRSGSG